MHTGSTEASQGVAHRWLDFVKTEVCPTCSRTRCVRDAATHCGCTHGTLDFPSKTPQSRTPAETTMSGSMARTVRRVRFCAEPRPDLGNNEKFAILSPAAPGSPTTGPHTHTITRSWIHGSLGGTISIHTAAKHVLPLEPSCFCPDSAGHTGGAQHKGGCQRARVGTRPMPVQPGADPGVRGTSLGGYTAPTSPRRRVSTPRGPCAHEGAQIKGQIPAPNPASRG